VPRQNRVTPCGEIVALEGRGLLMGNRGVLHDDARRIVRSWQVRRWIACRTEFRGRHREIMRPRSWTELFFLDDATALAAGHRPCGECRHDAYRTFRSLWERVHGPVGSVDDIDRVLHADRLDGRRKRVYRDRIAALPDGAYVALDARAWLVRGDALLGWSALGYRTRRHRRTRGAVDVLTPLHRRSHPCGLPVRRASERLSAGAPALERAQVRFALPRVDGTAIAFVLGQLRVAERVIDMVAERAADDHVVVERRERLPERLR
jgi:hypothetical protein